MAENVLTCWKGAEQEQKDEAEKQSKARLAAQRRAERKERGEARGAESGPKRRRAGPSRDVQRPPEDEQHSPAALADADVVVDGDSEAGGDDDDPWLDAFANLCHDPPAHEASAVCGAQLDALQACMDQADEALAEDEVLQADDASESAADDLFGDHYDRSEDEDNSVMGAIMQIFAQEVLVLVIIVLAPV